MRKQIKDVDKEMKQNNFFHQSYFENISLQNSSIKKKLPTVDYDHFYMDGTRCVTTRQAFG